MPQQQPTLTPVDYDPFADPGAGAEVPEGIKLTPVEGDPFARSPGLLGKAEAGADELVGAAQAFGEGVGGGVASSFGKLNRYLGMSVAGLGVLGDAIHSQITGKDEHGLQDAAFRNFVEPTDRMIEHAEGYTKNAVHPLAAGAGGAVGELGGDLATMIATDGTGQAGQLALKGQSLFEDATAQFANAMNKSTRMSALPASVHGEQAGEQTYEQTGDPLAAANAGLTEAGLTTLTNAFPVSVDGKLINRIATGAAAGGALGEAHREVMNTVTPQTSEFTWGGLAENALFGAALGGIMHHGEVENPNLVTQRFNALRTRADNGDKAAGKASELVSDLTAVDGLNGQAIDAAEFGAKAGQAAAQAKHDELMQSSDRYRQIFNSASTELDPEAAERYAKAVYAQEVTTNSAWTAYTEARKDKNGRLMQAQLASQVKQALDMARELVPPVEMNKLARWVFSKPRGTLAVRDALQQTVEARKVPDFIESDQGENFHPDGALTEAAFLKDRRPEMVSTEYEDTPEVRQALAQANVVPYRMDNGLLAVLGHVESVDALNHTLISQGIAPATEATHGPTEVHPADQQEAQGAAARPAGGDQAATGPAAEAGQPAQADGRDQGQAEVVHVSSAERAQPVVEKLVERGVVAPVSREGTITVRPGDGDEVAQHAMDVAAEDTYLEPTPEQAKAGNYRKGGVLFKSDKGDIRVRIETPDGAIRKGPWGSRKIRGAHYGYIPGTRAADGDPVDVLLTHRAHDDALPVAVINQHGKDGQHDEIKVVLGVKNRAEAMQTYLKQYPPGMAKELLPKGKLNVTMMSRAKFLRYLKSGQTDVPPHPVSGLPMESARPANENAHRTDFPVVELPLKRLTLSSDVPQFKSDANAEGVVEPLGGAFDRRGSGPIQVWERSDGRMEVISGRHRLDLAKRSGEKTIPAQVYREAEGFTAAHAASLDAELNIRDGQGKVKDYVQYFQDPAVRQTAEQRGLLARATGRRAYAIASKGTPELIAAHSADRLSDEAAVQISEVAPGDERMQALGMKLVQEGKSITVAVNTMRAVKSMGPKVTSGDMFGFDDSAIQEGIQMAGIASRHQREIADRLNAISGAAKRPELARKEGIDVRDAKAVQARMAQLKAEREAWENWATDPDKVAAIRAELGQSKVAEDQTDFFGTPTAAERNRAAIEAKDAERNGKGRPGKPNTSVDLFDGRVPEQTDIEGAERVTHFSAANQLPLLAKSAAAKAARRKADPAADGTLELFTPDRQPTIERKSTAARLFQFAKLVDTGTFHTGIRKITKWQDVAHIVAPIRKSPQEQAIAVVADAEMRPIAVIRHTVGVIDASLIHPVHFAGAIASVPGARHVWFAHNHPSGRLTQSTADHTITERLTQTLHGSGIEPHGMIVVGPGRKTATYLNEATNDTGNEGMTSERPVTTAARTGTLPRLERRLRKIGHSTEFPEKIAGPNTAMEALRHFTESGKQTGVLLLDNQHHVTGWLPMSDAEMAKLRTNNPDTGLASVLRTLTEANASAVIIAPEHLDSGNNIAGMMQSGDIRVLDVVMLGKGGEMRSAASMGRMHPKTAFAHLNREGYSRASLRRQQTSTPAFKHWFGKSKVVDAKGEPLVVYHGTTSDVPVFRHSRFGHYYFTDDPAAASVYADVADPHDANGYMESGENGVGPNVIPVYLSIKNPLVLDGKWQRENMDDDGEWNWEILDQELYMAEGEGHDGAILRGFMDYSGSVKGEGRKERPYNQYVAFKPEQIKSATGNSGAFDSKNPDINAALNHNPTLYSGMARTLEAAKNAPKKAPPVAWKGWLDGAQRRGEIKQGEREWIGIDRWLGEHKGAVSREEVLDFIQRRTAEAVRKAGIEPTTTPPTHEAVVRHATKFMAGLKGRADFTVHKAPADLPETHPVRTWFKAIGAPEDLAGVFYNGRMYLFSGRVRSLADMEQITLHEMVGHGGMRAVFGDAYNDFLKAALPAMRETELFKSVEATYRGQIKYISDEGLADEYMAALAEDADNPAYAPVWKRLLSAARNWLRSHGFSHLKWTEADLKALVRETYRGIREGRISVSGKETPTVTFDEEHHSSTATYVNAKGARGFVDHFADGSRELRIAGLDAAGLRHVERDGLDYLDVTGALDFTDPRELIHLSRFAGEEGLDGVLLDKSAISADQLDASGVPYVDLDDAWQLASSTLTSPMASLRNRAVGTPAQEAILKKTIAHDQYNMTFGQRMQKWARDLRDRILSGDSALSLKQGFVDAGAVIGRYERNLNGGQLLDAAESAYKSYWQSKNTEQILAGVMKLGVPEYNGSFVPVAGRKGLMEIFAPLYQHPSGQSLDMLWEGYAYARRANELIQQTNKDGSPREKLLDQDEIDELLKLEEQYPQFKQILDDYQTFNNQLLDLAVDRGALSPEMAELWKQNTYVPFYRAAMDGNAEHTQFIRTKGISGKKVTSRTLHGSELASQPIIENIIKNTGAILDKIYGNEAMRRVVALTNGIGMERVKFPASPVSLSLGEIESTLAKLGLHVGGKNPATGRYTHFVPPQDMDKLVQFYRMSKPIGHDIVSVMENGRPVYYKVTDPMLLRAVTAFTDINQFDELIGTFFGIPAKLIRQGVVLDPRFMFRNAFRDTVTTWAQSGLNPNVLKDLAKNAKEIYTDGNFINALRVAGYNGNEYYRVDQLREHLQELHGKERYTLLNTGPKLYHAYHKIGFLSEQMNRMAMARKVLASGGSMAEAAWQAQNTLNFQMRGDSRAMQLLIRMVPFLNARVQGLSRLYDGMTGRSETTSQRQAILTFLYKSAVLGAAALALDAWNWDDPRYDRIPEASKDTYYHFFIGDEHYIMPKPFEFGSITGTLPERVLRVIAGRDNKRTFADAMKRMAQNTFQVPTPYNVAAIGPLMEDWANKDAYTGIPIVNQSEQNQLPQAQYNARTSPLAKAVAKRMPAFAPDALRSPARLQHLYEGYTATLGTYFLMMGDAVMRATGHAPPQPSSRWGNQAVGAIMGTIGLGDAKTDPRTKYLQQYYDAQDMADQAAASVRKLVKEGHYEDAREILQDNKTPLAYRGVLKEVGKQMKALRQAEIAIYQSEAMTPDEKRARLTKIQQARIKLLDRVGPMLEMVTDFH